VFRVYVLLFFKGFRFMVRVFVSFKGFRVFWFFF
jgi:hypothetical protein